MYLYGMNVENSKVPLMERSPIAQGLIQNVEDTCFLIQNINEKVLKVDSSEWAVNIIINPLTSSQIKHQLMECVFEKLDAPYFYAQPSPNASLTLWRKKSGIIVDCGFGATTVTPIMNLSTIDEAIKKTTNSGSTVINYLLEREKQKFNFPDIDGEARIKKSLPQLKIPPIPSSPSPCDIFFAPRTFGLKCESVQGTLKNAIESCPMADRRELLSNVILTDGVAAMKGKLTIMNPYSGI